MTQPKFTPGPWTLDDAGKAHNFRLRHDNGALLFSLDAGTETEVSEDRANAALISAAPELYAALELALADIEETDRHYGTFSPSAKRARAALAKARGEG